MVSFSGQNSALRKALNKYDLKKEAVRICYEAVRFKA